jgi:hypothetical protein
MPKHDAPERARVRSSPGGATDNRFVQCEKKIAETAMGAPF